MPGGSAPVWDLPHHQYRGHVVTVGGMAGAACAEWHLHAWDLARALGKDYLARVPGHRAGRLAGRACRTSRSASRCAVATCGAGPVAAVSRTAARRRGGAWAVGPAGNRRVAGAAARLRPPGLALRGHAGGHAGRMTRQPSGLFGLRQAGDLGVEPWEVPQS